MSYIPLSYSDIAMASILLIANGALSILFHLKIEGTIIIAAIRMVLQLTLVGFVLASLFAAVSPFLTMLVAVFMILFAGREIMARQERRLKGWWAYGLGSCTMLVAASSVTILALLTQIRPEPWYHPRYALPLLGMILGNTMTGISLGLDTMTTSVVREKKMIEARLALGADRRSALQASVQQAMRSGLMPMINSMSAIGIVSLPGMMTGQILAGVEPQQAVKYQLLIMFLITGGTGFGVLTAVLLAVYRLTDERHRLRLDRLSDVGGRK